MTRRIPVLCLFALAGLAAACGDGGETRAITRSRHVESPPRIPPMAPFGNAVRFGMGGAGRPAPVAAAPATPAYDWVLPEGWKETRGDGMRLGSFDVAGHPEIDASLVVLSGAAGGVPANVNRWRGQMGLDPAPEAEIEALPKLEVLSGEALFVSLDGTYSGMGGESHEGWRMLGVVARDGGSSVFLKMVGPVDAVEDARPAFLDLAASLRRSEPTAGAAPGIPDGHPAVGGADAPGALSFDVPEGWTKGGEKSMRLVTLHPAGREDTECYVVGLSGDGGGVAANVNRWRGQMGQAPLSGAEIEALPKIDMLGQKAVLVEIEGTYTGMGDTRQAGAGFLGAILILPGQSLFVKMTGPAEVVAAERERFLEFCGSLK